MAASRIRARAVRSSALLMPLLYVRVVDYT
jgi:hypothetical protein